MKKILILLFTLYNFSNADVAPGVLEKYKNNIFICTRVGGALDITRAMCAKFEHIYAIEQDEVLAKHAWLVIPSYFLHTKIKLDNYYIHCGNPLLLLPEILSLFSEPCTILLDSYFPERDYPEKENFVLEELDIIKKHPIKKHTILIDYIHLAGTPYFGNISLETVQNKLLEINSQYKFAFEVGGHLRKEKNAILVAYL